MIRVNTKATNQYDSFFFKRSSVDLPRVIFVTFGFSSSWSSFFRFEYCIILDVLCQSESNVLL